MIAPPLFPRLILNFNLIFLILSRYFIIIIFPLSTHSTFFSLLSLLKGHIFYFLLLPLVNPASTSPLGTSHNFSSSNSDQSHNLKPQGEWWSYVHESWWRTKLQSTKASIPERQKKVTSLKQVLGERNVWLGHGVLLRPKYAIFVSLRNIIL